MNNNLLHLRNGACRCGDQDQDRYLRARTEVDDSVENALAQIDSKGHAIPYGPLQLPQGGRVLKCGVGISSEQRNITQWRIIDAFGNVIENQDFLSKE